MLPLEGNENGSIFEFILFAEDPEIPNIIIKFIFVIGLRSWYENYGNRTFPTITQGATRIGYGPEV